MTKLKEFKGTQGDWESRISGFKDYIAVDTYGINGSNRSILYKPFNPQSDSFNEEYYQEWKANAKLIAAAPDLLEALQELLSRIPIEMKERWYKSVTKSNRAIKKAI